MTEEFNPCPICGKQPIAYPGYVFFTSISCHERGDHTVEIDAPKDVNLVEHWNSRVGPKKNERG